MILPPVTTMLRPIATAAMGLLLSACSTVGYYSHVARGQGELVMQRRDVTTVLSDPSTDQATRQRLMVAQEARRFASTHLDLPDNRS